MVVQFSVVGEGDGMMRGNAPREAISIGPVLETERQGGSAVLTSGEKSVSVDIRRGQEAEDTIRDIVFLSERLISLVGDLSGRK